MRAADAAEAPRSFPSWTSKSYRQQAVVLRAVPLTTSKQACTLARLHSDGIVESHQTVAVVQKRALLRIALSSASTIESAHTTVKE